MQIRSRRRHSSSLSVQQLFDEWIFYTVWNTTVHSHLLQCIILFA
jgi:hypothetical protein